MTRVGSQRHSKKKKGRESLTTLIISLHCINRLVGASETWCVVVRLVDRISNYNHD